MTIAGGERGVSLVTVTRETPSGTRSTATAVTPFRLVSSLVTALTQCPQLMPVTL